MVNNNSVPFKRILVAMDLTEMDNSIVKYTAELARKLEVEKIYFIHAVKKLEFPKELRETMKSKGRVPDERLKELMKDTIVNKFPNYQSFDIEYVVVEGKPEAEINRWADIKMVDLLVMGRKPKHSGSGILPTRLVRHSKTSVLLVPEYARPEFELLFVPVDFSEESAAATMLAIQMRERFIGASLKLFHANSLPSSFFAESRGGLSFMDYMDEFATNNMHAFKKRCGIVSCESVIDSFPEKGIANSIVSGAKQNKAQLMILGEKKHSTAAVFLMGSITEGVVQQVTEVPVMVVRLSDKLSVGVSKSTVAASTSNA